MDEQSIFTPKSGLVRSPIILQSGKQTPEPPMIPPKTRSPKTMVASPSYNVPTNNSFDVLLNNKSNGDGVTHNVAIASASGKMQRQRKVNIPPFVFTSATDFKSGLDIVYKHAKGNHYIKYMRVGTKIQVDSMESYVAIDKEMSKAKLKYFTHDLIVVRPAKFVINGLHLIPIDELEHELKINGLEPSNIQCVSVKKPRFDSEHIYSEYGTKNKIYKPCLNYVV